VHLFTVWTWNFSPIFMRKKFIDSCNSLSVSWANLTEWSSDCWCIWKSLGVNACLQWRNVFSFHWRSVFVQFFANFSRLSLTAHQSLNAGIAYEHYCLCSGYGRTIVSLRIPSCILSRAGARMCGTRTFQTPSIVGQWNQASGLFDFERRLSG
jgi:hypothetical protein